MSNTGQAVLSIGGAAVGFLIGGPFGAQVGYLIGSGAGQLLYPTDLPGVKGPRLSDLTIQTSTIGAPIPIVYGTFALAGNVIWSGGLIEVVSEEEQGGGKGGGPPQTVTTYTYFCDFAVGICEGEIQGFRKIWADAKVIYDLSPQGDDETDEDYAARLATSQQTADLMTIYLGSETQLADPTIESYEGSGEVPAFRGLAYVVFDQLPLADYGNRIPNLRFEVYTGTATEEDCTQYSAGNLLPWTFLSDPHATDPRNPGNNHLYGYTELGGLVNKSFAEALQDLNDASDHTPVPFLCGETPQEGDSLFIHGWSQSPDPSGGVQPCAGPAFVDWVEVQMTLNTVQLPGSADLCSGDLPGNSCADWHSVLGGDGSAYVSAGGFSGVVATAPLGDYPQGAFGGVQQTSGDVNLVQSFCNVGGDEFNVWRLQSHELGVVRSLLPPDPCTLGTPISGAPGFCVVDGEIQRSLTWEEQSGTWHVLRSYADTGGGDAIVTAYPLGPARISTHPEYNDQAFWEAAYAEAVAAGDIEAGLVYGVDYPETQSYGFVGECSAGAIEPECVTLASIVEDICERAGLTSVDVTDLTTCIHGYCISRVMSARDALEPLRIVGLFDAVESGEELKFIERGHATVATIDDEDLCAHPYGNERPSAVETNRIQEKELPRRVRLHHASPDRNYEPGEQSASRITTEAITEQDVEVSVALSDEEAAQLSEILLYDSWVGRNSYRFSLGNAWLHLEPTDCLQIPVDGQLERARITSMDYSIGGIIQVEAVRDDDGSYVSTAVPSTPAPSGNQSGGSSSVVCPSEAVFLDLPRLREADTDAGYYAGVYGLCNTWSCASVWRSADGGDNYRQVGSTNVQATIGTILDIGPDTGDTSDTDQTGTDDTSDTPLDYSVVIQVELAHGTLSSTTGSGLAAGINTAAVGAHGRWEILQFRNAILVTGNIWELTGLSRGLLGTDANMATVGDGDTFVLLSGPGIFRIPEECSQVNIEKLIKVPSCGESLGSVDAEQFTTEGLSCRTNLISETPPNDGDVPIFNPGTGQYEPGCLQLRNLCDVVFDSSVNDGDGLIYDAASDSFVFEPVASTSSGGGSGDGYPAALGHSGI